MVNRKPTTQSGRSPADQRAKEKAVKQPTATKKAAPKGREDSKRAGKKSPPDKSSTIETKDNLVAADEDAGAEDRLRAHLRSSGVPLSLVKPIAGAVAKLIDLAANNRSGLQSSLSYINNQPSSALPPEPPEYFRNRPIDPATGKRETIVKFLERVWYKPWIAERLLTRTELRRLDLPAATALNNFLHAPKERWEPKNELPPHLVVPTKSEVNDALLEDADRVREARRIVDARWRRQRGLVRGKK